MIAEHEPEWMINIPSPFNEGSIMSIPPDDE